MKKILLTILLMPSIVFASQTIKFNKTEITFDEHSFKLYKNGGDENRATYIYTSPRIDKDGIKINSSFGIIIEKVPDDADPIVGYDYRMIQFDALKDNKVPKFTNRDDFMKIPNSCGTIFLKKYNGMMHKVLFVISIKNNIAITIIADTTEDTFSTLEAEYKNMIKSFKVKY